MAGKKTHFLVFMGCMASIACIVVTVNVFTYVADQAPENTLKQEIPQTTADPKDDILLMLVNKDHAIPDNYKPNLVEIRGDQKVDKRIVEDLTHLMNDARAAGFKPQVNSGYRSPEYQQELIDKDIKHNKAKGMSDSAARKATFKLIAKPNHSEHQLGLAVDFGNEDGTFNSSAWYDWLKVNSWKYGFILRYPEGKEHITHISYERWHFRYVGHKAAQEMYERNQTLEEYLGQT